MNIFFYNTTINRDRANILKKELYKNQTKINLFNQEKNLLNNIISADSSSLYEEVRDAYSRIEYLDEQILEKQNIINYIIKQLSNTRQTSNEVDIFNITKNQSYIFNTHNYDKLEPTTFAPSYSIRFKFI